MLVLYRKNNSNIFNLLGYVTYLVATKRGETFDSLLVASYFLLIACYFLLVSRYFLLVAQQETLKDFFE